jgi:two-component system, NarL family, sensor histidine kinase BarA
MLRRVSLANKCLLLFGIAVVGIIGASLLVALFRMNAMIDEGELAAARQAALVWQGQLRRLPASSSETLPSSPERLSAGDVELLHFRPDQIDPYKGRDEIKAIVQSAWRQAMGDPGFEQMGSVDWGWSARRYIIAVPLRAAAGESTPGTVPTGDTADSDSAAADPSTAPAPNPDPAAAASASPSSALPAPGARRPTGLVLAVKTSNAAASSLWLSLVFLVSVGIFALGLAVLVFYLITNKIILQPVRQLRATAEDVRSGNLDTRSDIQTGDELEELAEAFNEMLAALQTGQEQQRTINASLDEKINQLAERNQTLYQAARIKGEFLASVSHELRTPLNSVLGFAELLEEQAAREAEAGEDTPKIQRRKRYIDNILTAGRSLLDLINGLLEMAKVEAGKVDLKVKSFGADALCEQLIAMMRPQADKRGVELSLEIAENLPELLTDQGKLRQIIFNLLSNAVKFTGDMAEEIRSKQQQRASEAELMDASPPTEAPPLAKVTLRAEPLITRNPATGETEDRVRFCVIDTGPGIAPEDQARIFEKFTQLDSGYGRKHAGTGLGLAICKELTTVLQGELLLQSQLGRGSMFSVIIPAKLDDATTAENKLELAFRGNLSKPAGPADV